MALKTYKVQDINTGEIYNWSVKQILKEINRDRSEGWENYNKNDWREGWNEWCEGDCYRILNETQK